MSDIFETFNPQKYEGNFKEALLDDDIEEVLNTIKKISPDTKDIYKGLNNLKQFFDDDDKKKIKLIKLLYNLEYYPEMFLNIGIIMEKYINSVATFYLDNKINHEKIPNFFKRIEDFKLKTLSEKSELIIQNNLFEEKDINNFISGKLKALTVLRNYGGHAKCITFFEQVFEDKDAINQEVMDAINLINKIITAAKALQEKHN